MTSSLEELLHQVASRGLRFAGLYEKPVFAGKGWRCSLSPAHDPKAPWFVGEHINPARAIAKALDQAAAAGHKPRQRDLDDIL